MWPSRLELLPLFVLTGDLRHHSSQVGEDQEDVLELLKSFPYHSTPLTHW